MYGCRTVKKVEHLRIDAFKLWCWRRLLSVPWTARKLNQSILKEIFPEYSLEGLMLKLKLQYFCHLMQRANSLEKDLDAGKDWGQKEKREAEDEMVGWHHQLNGYFLLFSCSVISNSLQPHGWQQARLLSNSLSPRVCSNSCPLSQ